MKIRITPPYPNATSSGIFGGDGKEIPIGTELTVEKEPKDWGSRYEILSGSTAGKEAVLNADMGEAEIGDTAESAKTQENLRGTDGSKAEGSQGGAGFKVEESSPGWYVVTKDGTAATKKFRKADLEGFDTLSDAEKTAFVDENKAED